MNRVSTLKPAVSAPSRLRSVRDSAAARSRTIAADLAGTPYPPIAVAYILIRIGAFAGVQVTKFNDSFVYLAASHYPLFSEKFLEGIRTPVAPVLYLIFPTDHLRTGAQFVISVICWLFLAGVVAYYLRNRGVRIAAFAAVLVFSMSTPIIMWDPVVLTESLALSLTAAVVAAWIVFLHRPTVRVLAGLLVLTLLWTFDRDTNAYLVVMLAVLLVIAIFFTARRRLLALGAAVMVLIAVASYFSNVGVTNGNRLSVEHDTGRWVYPLINVIGTRILPDPSREKWFVDHGMPAPPALLRLSGQFAVNNSYYTDPRLLPWRRWLASDGRSTYTHFLISHPKYLLGQPWDNKEELISPDVSGWRPADFKAALPTEVQDIVYPPDNQSLWFWLIPIAVFAVLAVRRVSANRLWLVPLFLILSAVPHAIVVWNGDSMDTTRHALLIAVMIRLGAIILLLVALDAFLVRRTRPDAVGARLT